MDNLRFYFVTWNVATRSPGQDLNALLDFPSQFNKSKALADFYVIGLQEVKSQPQNMIMDTIFNDAWTAAFNKILSRQRYVVVKTIRLQGILLLVYTQMKHVTHLRDIEAQYTKTGLGGMWGNKGAVSVRFNLYGCSVCLVNCHLTAHEHLLADRVNDYNTIIKQHLYHISETSNILYHDYVFWIGDLNFRTDYPSGNSPTSEEIVAALQKVEKDKYTALLKHDQLLAVMSTGEAFSEFTEPEIRFPPTYKFSIGGDEYDIKRKPSWTDRILYKVIANNYENITLRADLISYNHLAYYTVSDHKPVIAQFNIKTRCGFTSLVIPEKPKIARAGVRMRSAKVAPTSNVQMQSTLIDSGRDLDTCEPVAMSAALIEENILEVAEEAISEAFSNYTEKTVEFAPINNVWYIGDADLMTQCTLTPDVEVNPGDWIGIYDADFYNLDDYKAYEYLAKVSLPERPAASGQPRTIVLSIPVGSGIRTPGFYRLIYFSQPNNDVRSVLGISEPFEVSSKEERLVALDTPNQPSSSGSPGHAKATTSADVFSEFTGLDVTKLSRHFSHDLSID